jgi:hypothetical protein
MWAFYFVEIWNFRSVFSQNTHTEHTNAIHRHKCRSAPTFLHTPCTFYSVWHYMNIFQVTGDRFISPYARVHIQNVPLQFPINKATPVRYVPVIISVSPCPPSVDQSCTFIYLPNRGLLAAADALRCFRISRQRKYLSDSIEHNSYRKVKLPVSPTKSLPFPTCKQCTVPCL